MNFFTRRREKGLVERYFIRVSCVYFVEFGVGISFFLLIFNNLKRDGEKKQERLLHKI